MESDTATYIRPLRSIIKDQEKKQIIQLINTYNVSLRPHLAPADITTDVSFVIGRQFPSIHAAQTSPLIYKPCVRDVLYVCSYMFINKPTVSEQVRQLRESQKRKNEKAQSQKNQFNGTRFVNICLVMCKTSTYTVQLCTVCQMS